MRIFLAVCMAGILALGVMGATAQTQYPDPTTWMADCPTAIQADYIAYHWVPGASPSQRDWCTLVVESATQNSLVYVVPAPLDGIGLSPAFSTPNWNGSELYNEVAITTMQSITEEEAHLTALYALVDARIAMAPGQGPTQAEHDAAVARIDILETQLGTFMAEVITLQNEVIALQTKQTNMYDALKAFHILFDPNQ